MKTVEYSVCEDCRMYVVALENDDYSSYDYYFNETDADLEIQRMSNAFNDEFADVGRVIFDFGDDYEEFSWQACELCNSRLGGNRYNLLATIMED